MISQLERHQTVERIINQELDFDVFISALERFHDEPDLQKAISENPFTVQNTSTLESKFSKETIRETRIAAVTSEKRGVYDLIYDQMPIREERDALYKQIESSADSLMRTSRWVYENMESIWEMPDDLLFDRLKELAYGTLDSETIHASYSRQQRSKTNMALVNFVQDRAVMRSYRDNIEADKDSEIARIFGISLQHEVTVECLPVGLVVYLSPEDYSSTQPEGVQSANGSLVLMGRNIPKDLWGRLIKINTKQSDTEESEYTRRHELSHLLFHNYVLSKSILFEANFNSRLNKLDDDLDQHKDLANKLITSSLEYARDEMIAYSMEANDAYKYVSLHALGDRWDGYFEVINERILKMPNQEKTPELLKIYFDAYSKYLRDVRQYRWVYRRLLEKVGEDRSEEYAYALAYSIPANRVLRVGKFLGIEPPEFAHNYDEEMSEKSSRFTNNVIKASSSSYNVGGVKSQFQRAINWYDAISFDDMKEMETFYPVEAIPAYLMTISESNHPYRVRDSLEALKYSVLSLETIPPELMTQVDAALDKLVTQNNDELKEAQVNAETIREFLKKVILIRASA